MAIFSMSTFVLLTFAVFTAGQVRQEIHIYNSTDCSGLRIHGATSSGLVSLIPNAKMRSVFIIGLWRIRDCTSVTNCVPDAQSPPIKAYGTCFGVTFEATVFNLSRLGDPYMTEKRLNVYSGRVIDGQVTPIWGNMTSIDDQGTLLSMGSSFHTGNYWWTVYSGLNFTGVAECLRPDSHTVNNGYGVSRTVNVNYTVGSVREGCF